MMVVMVVVVVVVVVVVAGYDIKYLFSSPDHASRTVMSVSLLTKGSTNVLSQY